jgi:hypothetical protein
MSTGSVVYMEGDTFWSFIAKGGEDRGVHRNFRTIMSSMMAAAVPYAAADYEVVLDFSVPPWFIETALRIAAMRDVPLDYVVLRPSYEVCAVRAAERADGAIAIYEAYRDLYASFDEVAERHIVSDDIGSPAVIAKRIRKQLDDGAFRIASNKLERE